MRVQYHFRPSKDGVYIWDVHRLIRLTGDFPVHAVKLADIRELDESYWFSGPDSAPTCRRIAEHMQLVNAADLSYPIILSSDGRVMDGMHRVVKAFISGMEEVSAVKFKTDPEPDYIDVHPDDLLY